MEKAPDGEWFLFWVLTITVIGATLGAIGYLNNPKR